MNDIKKILIEVSSIKPGGGPFGYTYNLFEGYKKIKEKYPQILLYSYAEKKSERTKSKIEFRTDNIIFRLVNFAKKNTPDWFRKLKFRFSNKRKLMLEADVVLFQGFQSSIAIKSISKYVYTIYMPHSPTIGADEMLMNSRLYNISFSNNEYKKYLKQELKLIKNSKCIVFASKGAADEYFKYFSKELNSKKIEYIASGIDLPENSNEQIENPEIKNGIFFIGRYVEHKGYDLYCKTAEIVKKTHPEIKFFSIGGGPLNPNQFVTDLGWQENPYPFIHLASVIVIPNTYSYYDLLPLECAALAKPLVMTKVGGSADQLVELPDTIACKAESQDLSNAITAAYYKKQIDENWGEKNRIKYNCFFDSKSFAERWCEFLNELLIK